MAQRLRVVLPRRVSGPACQCTCAASGEGMEYVCTDARVEIGDG
jgi:hypothetical protein